MISRVFIDRPILAWVISIILMLAGVGAIMGLPIAQYPDVAPTQVNIRATYPGASADILTHSVTQILEQQLNGIDDLLYFQSSSSSNGVATVSVIFDKSADPDIAQVQVQNRIQQAMGRLPQEVQQQGVTVTKSNPDFLLVAALYDETDALDGAEIADYLVSNVQDTLSRLEGVGDIRVFGSQHAMRIWLDPDRLFSYSLMPSDINAAILAQNADVAAGAIGIPPMPADQYLTATVTSESRLQTPEQFRQIIVKSDENGATIRLGDVARVEIGAESYSTLTRVNAHPGSGLAVSLGPGADALSTAERVKAEMARLSGDFPQGVHVAFPLDSTAFIELSIDEVVETLIIAIVLVVIIMFVFLQSWRATLIPTIAVPVVILGTFAVLYAFGFSINTLTLFGLVLAIGLLVDDAIVVVENVERLLEENPEMTPHEATVKSMQELQTALIGIAVVLSAVFLPMAFFGGSTGVIYRQFSVTIISAMVLSVVVALVLSPVLTASLLRQRSKLEKAPAGWRARGQRFGEKAKRFFNGGLERLTRVYLAIVRFIMRQRWVFLLLYAGLVALLAFLFMRMPTSFLPTEDQGSALVQFRLPAGATQNRALEVQQQIEEYFLTEEADNVGTIFTASGTGGGGTSGGQNMGIGYLAFRDWSEREGEENSASAIMARASQALQGIRDAQIFALVLPPIRGLGQSNGFTMELRNTGDLTPEAFEEAKDQLLAEARQNTQLAVVRSTELPPDPTLHVVLDHEALSALQLRQADVASTLSTAWGGRYINDFIDEGRVKRVFVQGDAPYRRVPSDLASWFVRSTKGDMVSFSSFARTEWTTAPLSLSRFSGLPSYEFQGQAAAGVSSGEAMEIVAGLAGEVEGTDVAWAGLSYQERESSGQAVLLYGVSLVVIFLCLAVLFASWSIPLAVLLAIPLGLMGAVLAVMARGLENDVFFQIGLLTTMGLAAKNAILMIEFAEAREKEGDDPIEAMLEAARLRLRPILMTSVAFMAGVLPLAISTGAGANSRIAIGTTVIGGMITATSLAIIYIPLLFVFVRRGFRGSTEALTHAPASEPD